MPHITPSAGRYARRARLSLGLGVTLTVVGAVTMMLTAYHADLPWWRVVGWVAMLGMITGVTVGGVSLLAMKGRSIEEAYTLGYDLGFERGLRASQYPDDDDPESVSAALDDLTEVPRPRHRQRRLGIHPKAERA